MAGRSFDLTLEPYTMGIVVCVFMLLGLLMATPWLPAGLGALRFTPRRVDVLASGMFLAGLWNSLWYGLRHVTAFWGLAALVSGAIMAALAVVLLVERGGAVWRRQSTAVRAHAMLKPWGQPLILGLALCFLLYAVALVRLNLGLSIPG